MRNDDVYLQLYLIRHAESMGNIETNESYNRINPPLTSHGEAQASAAGERFAAVPLDAVYSSSLLRAEQTASKIAVRCKKDIIIDNRLLEHGIAENGDVFADTAESDELCAERAAEFIAFLKSNHAGGSVAVVSHGEFIQFLIRAALGITLEQGIKFCIFNASVTKINFRYGKANKLALQNDISHLAALDGDKLSWM